MSHFAAVLLWDFDDAYNLIFYVIDYQCAVKGVQVKFPGGTNNDYPLEKPLDTVRREAEEETGLILPANDGQIVCILTVKNGEHTKYFFLVRRSECRGTMRTEVKRDDGDQLSPPYPLPYDGLRGIIFRTHAPALEEALKRLS